MIFAPKILLVDDEPIILKGLSRELIAENYAVTAVSSGSDAINALRDTFYDLVITDLTMQGINGVDVVKAVKIIAPLTLLIVITGYSDSTSAREVTSIGVDDFLVKPFEIEELFSSIQACLNKRRLH
jgi:YesN/AraC family two-component response regulator